MDTIASTIEVRCNKCGRVVIIQSAGLQDDGVINAGHANVIGSAITCACGKVL